MYLVFLIGQSWLTELSWQSGSLAERSSVVLHENSLPKNSSIYAQTLIPLIGLCAHDRRKLIGLIYAVWIYGKLSHIWYKPSCLFWVFFFFI